MSRIGKKPVEIPAGVEVKVDGTTVTVKGPKGTLTQSVHPNITISIEGNVLTVARPNDQKENRSLHGLTRTLINNMIVGVTDGYSKKLQVNGVGYRVAKEGQNLNLQLGYSHPVKVEAPQGIEFVVEGTNKITVKGANKQLVGDIAAEIRGKRRK